MFVLKSKFTAFRNRKKLDKIKYNVTRVVSEESLASMFIPFFFRIVILTFFGGLLLFPFMFMVLGALHEVVIISGQPEDIDTLIPETFSWGNFMNAMEEGYWFALLNTTLVTSLSIGLQIIISMMMGYALSFKKWFGKRLVWYFSLTMLMIPQIALLVGQYQVIVNYDIRDGFMDIVAMILPYVASVFSAYMFRNAFEAIPQRTKEAALIDGVSQNKFLWSVGIKMVMPTVWTVGILTAFASWNSYMWPAILGAGTEDFRNPLGLWLFTTGRIITDESGSQSAVVPSLRLAASIIAMSPLFIVYFLFRKQIMDAVAKRGTAIKG